jgi:hypothetical protein
MLIGTAEWGTLSILYNTLSQTSSKQIVAPRFNARLECAVSLGYEVRITYPVKTNN